MTRDTLNVTDFTAYWLEQAYNAQRGRELLGLANFSETGVSVYYGFDANGVLGMWPVPSGGGGVGNLDGGTAFSVYGGTSPIDGGGA